MRCDKAIRRSIPSDVRGPVRADAAEKGVPHPQSAVATTLAQRHKVKELEPEASNLIGQIEERRVAPLVDVVEARLHKKKICPFEQPSRAGKRLRFVALEIQFDERG